MLATAGEAYQIFRRGCVIPAHPLALTARRSLDERRQRALTRYYLEAGAGGVAVGVHTTQFAIHDNGMLRPVLEISAEAAAAASPRVLLVAGVQGPTRQAVAEAELAAAIGYHLVLLRPENLTERELVDRARAVGEVRPVVAFYLQPAVGGRRLSRDFWSRLSSVESVVGIKVAPFDRYLTVDVLNAVCRSGRAGEIALYTGNDNQIVGDLLTTHGLDIDGSRVEASFVGGLLGQWAVWTRRAVDLLEQVASARQGDGDAAARLRTLDPELTDANAAIFDAAGGFRGCVPGIHEVLRRQGLLAGRWCLDPAEELSPGQLAEIDRVMNWYPHLRDDDFVASRLDTWLG